MRKILIDIKTIRNLPKIEKEKKTKVPIVSYKAKFALNFNLKFFNVNFFTIFTLNLR